MQPIKIYSDPLYYISVLLSSGTIFAICYFGFLRYHLFSLGGIAFENIELLILAVSVTSFFSVFFAAINLVRARWIYIEVSVLGLVCTRLYNSILPWSQIRSIEYRKNGYEREGNHDENLSEYIELQIQESYLVDDIGDKWKQHFGAYTDDGWVILRIRDLGLTKDIPEIYDIICNYWEADKVRDETQNIVTDDDH